jgi:hypothetical protein
LPKVGKANVTTILKWIYMILTTATAAFQGFGITAITARFAFNYYRIVNHKGNEDFTIYTGSRLLQKKHMITKANAVSVVPSL